MKHITAMIFGAAWLAGIVLAQGFWLTVAAVFVPFYAWYLVVERVMRLAGVL